MDRLLELVTKEAAVFGLDHVSLNCIYSLPDSIRQPQGTGEVMMQVLKLCVTQLVEVYDVSKVLTDKGLREQFQLLCFRAVLDYLQCEDLQLESENSLLLALDAWMDGPNGRSCDVATRRELAGQIRMCRLDRSFLFQVLLHLPWLRLTERQRGKLLWFATSPKELQKCALANKNYPPSGSDTDGTANWYKENRDGLRSAAECVLELTVTRAQLEAGISDVLQSGTKRVFESPGQVCNGLLSIFQLTLRPCETLSLGMVTRLPWLASSGAASHDSPCAVSEDIMLAGASFTISRYQGDTVWSKPAYYSLPLKSVVTFSTGSFLEWPPDPLAISDWEQLLHNGQLQLRATIHMRAPSLLYC